ncbi:MAG TPA: hypothetical protein DCF33_01955 [Saprospirales bacterium]|nr:hypothetical protein [Saprospirales bacterium]
MDYTFLGLNNELAQVDQTVKLRFFNPKVGATYYINPSWQSYIFAGIGHREPNRDDFTQSSPQSRPKSEQMLNVELGARHSRENLKLAANLFWMQYKNQLVLNGQINDVGAFIRTNVPDSRRIGLELEAEGQLSTRLAWAASASFSQNKVKEFSEYVDNWDLGTQSLILHRNTALAFSPAVVCRAEAGWTWWRKFNPAGKGSSLSSTLVSKYVSRQYLDNTSNVATSLPEYLVNDIRLNWNLDQFIGEKLVVIFSVNNVLDHQYESNGWSYRFTSSGYDPRPDNPYARLEQGDKYHLAGFFPQAGRHWMATVQLTF